MATIQLTTTRQTWRHSFISICALNFCIAIRLRVVFSFSLLLLVILCAHEHTPPPYPLGQTNISLCAFRWRILQLLQFDFNLFTLCIDARLMGPSTNCTWCSVRNDAFPIGAETDVKYGLNNTMNIFLRLIIIRYSIRF